MYACVMRFFKNRNISIEIKSSILVSEVKQRLLKAINNKIYLCYMQSYVFCFCFFLKKRKSNLRSYDHVCNNCEIILTLNCPLL